MAPLHGYPTAVSVDWSGMRLHGLAGAGLSAFYGPIGVLYPAYELEGGLELRGNLVETGRSTFSVSATGDVRTSGAMGMMQGHSQPWTYSTGVALGASIQWTRWLGPVVGLSFQFAGQRLFDGTDRDLGLFFRFGVGVAFRPLPPAPSTR